MISLFWFGFRIKPENGLKNLLLAIINWVVSHACGVLMAKSSQSDVVTTEFTLVITIPRTIGGVLFPLRDLKALFLPSLSTPPPKLLLSAPWISHSV